MKSLDIFDKSIEERFDKKSYTIDESHFIEYDQKREKEKKSTFLNIEFSSLIPEDTKLFLTDKIPSILEFPTNFGLNVNHAKILLRFIDKTTYEKEIGRSFPTNIPLPASSLKIQLAEKKYKITIIIPKIIDKAEIIVNIARNIFSKIYGNVFFDEKLQTLEFYQQNMKGNEEIKATIDEILDLLNEFDYTSSVLNTYCENNLKTYKIDIRNKSNEIQKNLIKEWGRKSKEQRLSSEEKQTIESIFDEFIMIFKKNHEHFYNLIGKQIKKLNTEMHFILPHEMSAYNNFEKNQFSHYIRSVKIQLEEIYALLGFIDEINSLLLTNPKTDELKILDEIIRSRLKEMKKRKKVSHFSFSEKNNNSFLKDINKSSTLRLVKMLPQGTPLNNWNKEVKRLENNYISSIYTKIYLSLKSFSDWITKNREIKKENFIESLEGKNIKKILPIIKHREKSVRILKNNLGIFIDTSEKHSLGIKEIDHWHSNSKDNFLKAWSYFISSILTLLYFTNSAKFENYPKGFNANNFRKSILNFIEKKCSQGINYYHIVKLLWLIYEKKEKKSLEFVIFCIKKPDHTFRYILNQIMNPGIVEENLASRIKKLNRYRDSFLYVYKKKLRIQK